MERWHAKAITLFGCFIIPFVSTVLPIKVSSYFETKGNTGKLILSCLMCFGGGVFFSTYILHMAPESRTIVDFALKELGVVTTYPIADLIMALGFFLVLFVEKIIMIINEKRKSQNRAAKEIRYVQYSRPSTPGSPVANKCPGMPGYGLDCETGPKLANHRSNGKVMVDIEDLANLNKECTLLGSGACCKDPEEVTIQANAKEDTEFFPRIAIDNSGLNGHSNHDHEGGHEAMVLDDPHTSRALMLLVALSFHRIFEGMSIGLQKSVHNVFSLFMAVMFHEAAIGFSLGLQFVKKKWSMRLILLASFLCSLIMPIGVLAGTLIIELGNMSVVLDVVNGVLQSLATGTFIYVTFFEILQDELSHHDTGMARVTSVFIGFALMAALSAIPEEQPELLLGHEIGVFSDVLNDTLVSP